MMIMKLSVSFAFAARSSKSFVFSIARDIVFGMKGGFILNDLCFGVKLLLKKFLSDLKNVLMFGVWFSLKLNCE